MARLKMKTTLFAGIAILSAVSTSAYAQGEEPATVPAITNVDARHAVGYDLAYSQRPLTLTEGLLNPMGALLIGRTSVDLGGGITASDTFLSFVAGGDIGITDQLTVGLTVLPLLLSPEFEFGDLEAHGTFLLLEGGLDLGVFAQLVIPTSTDFQIRGGVPIRLFIGDNMKLDAAGLLHVQFAENNTVVSLELPVEWAMNFTPEMYLAVQSGFFLQDFDFDFVSIPLGVEFGYSLATIEERPFLDVYGTFSLPRFIAKGIKHFDQFALIGGARLFIDVF